MTEEAGDQAQFSTTRVRITLSVIIICTLAVLNSPIPGGMSIEAHRLIAIVFLMAALWATQIVSLAATSLVPLAMFPLLGIMTPKAVSKSYMSDTLFLYLGGMVIALGLEKWQLHRRLAYNVVSITGVSPKRLILGFLVATAALSMWISNTACTLLMLPIAVAMLQTLSEINQSTEFKSESSDNAASDNAASDNAASDGRAAPSNFSSDATQQLIPVKRLAVPLLLSIAYASSLGGMMTQVGTPTNSSAMGIYRDLIARNGNSAGLDVSMSMWMIACVPVGLLYLAITWLVLTVGLPGVSRSEPVLRGILRERLKALGRPDSAEIRMLIVFLITGTLWTFRARIELSDSLSIPGWVQSYAQVFNQFSPWYGGKDDKLADESLISDATIAMSMAILLFFIPSGKRSAAGHMQPLMDWPTASKLPWDMILLFGGGFAIADAFESTGLSKWLGTALQEPLAGQPPWLVIGVLCLMMTFLTEFTSNVATINTVLPTVLAMAQPLQIDARLLLIPVTLAASCAFMLPIGTPPNAIVFSTGLIPPRSMAWYGLILNLVGVPILVLGAIWIVQPLIGIP